MNWLRRVCGDWVRHRPGIRASWVGVQCRWLRLHQGLLRRVPVLARPRTYKVMIAVTGSCNARCLGCRYERDFMVGEQLPLPMVLGALDDARAAGYYTVRFYGGEPTLHPGLPRMVEHAVGKGLRTYVTTNATILAHSIPALYEAGLRDLSIGMYGIGQEYDEYTQRPGLFAKVERGIAVTRERYGGDVRMQMNWLLMRPRLDARSLRRAFEFALRYGMTMQIDLLHYSLPYFSEGPDGELQFREEDRPRIDEIVDELIGLKRAFPSIITTSEPGLRSIPDWLIRRADMRVPCNAAEMLWIGADGSVQLCYVCHRLGNLHERPLRSMLFGAAHRRAAVDSLFLRNCPNCHCSFGERVVRHAPSLRRYSS